jgi:hypothetical protein
LSGRGYNKIYFVKNYGFYPPQSVFPSENEKFQETWWIYGMAQIIDFPWRTTILVPVIIIVSLVIYTRKMAVDKWL